MTQPTGERSEPSAYEGRACSQPSGKAQELEAPVPEKAGGNLFESLSEDPLDPQSPLVKEGDHLPPPLQESLEKSHGGSKYKQRQEENRIENQGIIGCSASQQ